MREPKYNGQRLDPYTKDKKLAEQARTVYLGEGVSANVVFRSRTKACYAKKSNGQIVKVNGIYS